MIMPYNKEMLLNISQFDFQITSPIINILAVFFKIKFVKICFKCADRLINNIKAHFDTQLVIKMLFNKLFRENIKF